MTLRKTSKFPFALNFFSNLQRIVYNRFSLYNRKPQETSLPQRAKLHSCGLPFPSTRCRCRCIHTSLYFPWYAVFFSRTLVSFRLSYMWRADERIYNITSIHALFLFFFECGCETRISLPCGFCTKNADSII